jgi:limonene-1,2-epoxide hydrolase
MLSRICFLFIIFLGIGYGQTLTNRSHINSGIAVPAICTYNDFYAVNTSSPNWGLYICANNSNQWRFLPGVPVGAAFPNTSCTQGGAFVRTDQTGPNFYVCDPDTLNWVSPSDKNSFNFSIVQSLVSSISINGGPPLVGNIGINTAITPPIGMVISDGTNLLVAQPGVDYLDPHTGVTSLNGATGAVFAASVPATAGVVASNGSILIPAVDGTNFLSPTTGVTTVNGSHGAVVAAVAPVTVGMVKSNGTTLIAATSPADFLTSSTGVTTVNGASGPVIAATAPIAGVVKSTGTVLAKATDGTDYLSPTTGVVSVNGLNGVVTTVTAPTLGVVKSTGTALAHAIDGTDYLSPSTGVISVNGANGVVTTVTAPSTGIVGSNGSALTHAVDGTDYLSPTTGVISVNGSHGAVTAATAPVTVGMVKSNGTTLVAATSPADFLTSSTGVTSVNGSNGAVTTVTAPIAGIVKSTGTALAKATDGTDYLSPTTGVTTFNGTSGAITVPAGITKSPGPSSALVAAVAGTDFIAPNTLFVTNPQTATYQVLAADFSNCKTIPVASGTFTITLVASTSQPLNGQCVTILNYGTGVITVARSGQNLNGGVTSLTIPAGSATAPTGAYVISDGTNYEAQLDGIVTGTTTTLNGASGAITVPAGITKSPGPSSPLIAAVAGTDYIAPNTLFVTNAQTATYQVLAADFANCKTIPVASGTFTITLVASSSQPLNGQCITILNYGTGIITVSRSGQAINGGVTSLTIPAGSATAPTGAYVISDGTNYEAQLEGIVAGTTTTINGSSGAIVVPVGITKSTNTSLPLSAAIAGTDFILPGTLFVTNPQTATYQVLAADFSNCKTIPVASGTFTITLVASTSQPASGQCLNIINYGTGVITVARSGQNINGGTTSLTIPAGSATAPLSAYVVSDGTNYEATLDNTTTINGSSGAIIVPTGITKSTGPGNALVAATPGTDYIAPGTLFVTNAQTATYQVLAADFLSCKTIPVASGTFTVTLVASTSQPVSGQCVTILNYGTGVITVARSGQNLNGGTASLTLLAGSATSPTGAYVVSDGTNYEAQLYNSSNVTLAQLPSTTRLRTCEIHIYGDGTSGALQTSDSEVASCYNDSGATMTITAIRCYADNGSTTTTVTPIVTGGSSSSILSGGTALTCGNATFAAGTLSGTPTLTSTSTVDMNITAAGTAKSLRIVLTGTI